MKKQILILVIAIIPGLFISCSKQQNDFPEAGQTINEEIATSSSSANRAVVDPLTVNLEGWYTFDNTLKDKTGKLPDAVPTSRIYYFGKDRKGNLKSAMSFDSTYGLTIANVPQQTHTSLSVWIKYVNPVTSRSIISGYGAGPALHQVQNIFIGTVEVDNDGAFGDPYGMTANNNWHHLVVTYDGSNIREYMDGVLKSTFAATGTITSKKVKYYIARHWSGTIWRGYVDDLRFYSRTLTSTEVQSLFNL